MSIELTTIKVTDKQAAWVNAEIQVRNKDSLTKSNQPSVINDLIQEYGIIRKKGICPQCDLPIMGSNCPVCNRQD